MKWSWKLGQLAGIDLRIHATFLLLLGWIGASYWTTGKSMIVMLSGIGFIVALFVCVMFHELGHAIAARKFGIHTSDITLLPIGGLARLERMPEEPKQELWIALAGPAVNLAIAAVLYGWLTFAHQWEPFSKLGIATGPFVERLMLANIWLVLFNLIPAFPMDGGRVLRAVLATRMTHLKATQKAVWVGQGLAFVIGFIGLLTNPLLLFIGLFVWIGARQEARAAQMRSAFSSTPARAVMLTDFDTLQSGDTLAVAVHLMLKGSQQDFPVIDHGQPIGILTRNDLLVALADHGRDHLVTLVMRRDLPIAESGEGLDVVFQRLRESGCETMPVLQDGRLIGLVSMENLNEFLLIEEILQKRGARSGLESSGAARSRRAW
jgi:Zn-dependent protease/predicted transcriptional regulator